MEKSSPSWPWQSSIAVCSALSLHCLNIQHFMPQERKDTEKGGGGKCPAPTLFLITVFVEAKEAVWPHLIVNSVLFSKFVFIKKIFFKLWWRTFWWSSG